MEQEIDLRSYLNILQRRYLYLLIPAIVVFALTFTVAILLPPIYLATAKILVESQQIPTDLARPTVTSDALERLQIIQQRLTTRDNLLDIARKFNLRPSHGGSISPSDLVDFVRESTSIGQIAVSTGRSRRNQKQAIAFKVSYESRSPNTAAGVANELVGLILEQNIRSRTSRASETLKFFREQVNTLQQKIVSLESQIVEFKSKNEATLPDSLEYRRGAMTQLRTEIAEIASKIVTLEGQRDLLLRSPNTIVEGFSADPTISELDKLQLQLVQLRGLYTDSHPNVRSVKQQIAALQTALQNTPKSGTARKQDGKNLWSNGKAPANVNSANTSRSQVIGRQVELLKKQRDELQVRFDDVNKSVLQTPQVEIALNSLLREHENLQSRFNQAKLKMAEAETGERLEEDRQSERFEIIEQAAVPTKPEKPNRVRIILVGLFASIAAGVGLVLLMEMLDQSVRTSQDLEKRLSVRPIAVIPYISTREEVAARRRNIKLLMAGSAASIVVGLGLIHAFYLPLQLVIEKVLIRLAV